MRMERFENRFCWSRKTKQLINERVNSVDLVPDQIRKRIAKIGILVALWQQLSKGFKRDQRIFDLVRHSCRPRSQTGESVAAATLQFEAFNGGGVRLFASRSHDLTLVALM